MQEKGEEKTNAETKRGWRPNEYKSEQMRIEMRWEWKKWRAQQEPLWLVRQNKQEAKLKHFNK